MTQPTITDRDLKALFSARAAGTINPDLAQRIHESAASTKQRRPFLVIPGFGGGSPMRSLAFAATIGATSLALAGLLVIGGGDEPPVATPPAPSAPPAATPTPTPAPSATPTPPVSATPLPPGTRTPPETIERPRVNGLGWLAVPSVDLFADASESAAVLATLPSIGTDLFFLEGPVEAEGFVWWKVHPYSTELPVRETYPIGWVRAGVIASDEPPVLGYVPECPPLPIAVAETRELVSYASIACFGSEDVALTGRMSCSEADVEGVISGPDWLATDRSCMFETDEGSPLFPVYGDVVFDLVTPGQVVTGTFEVTAHVDDPQAATCVAAPIEGAPTAEEAVLSCRRLWVATAVTRLD
jgi:hypothetical protein